MKFGKELIEKVHKFDVEFTAEEANTLIVFALDRIKNDKDVLINYAVNVLLREYIDNLEKKEGVKDGKGNS